MPPATFPDGSFEAQVLDEIRGLKRSLSTCQRLHLGYEVVGDNDGKMPILPRGWQIQALSGGVGGGMVGAVFMLAKLLGL